MSTSETRTTDPNECEVITLHWEVENSIESAEEVASNLRGLLKSDLGWTDRNTIEYAQFVFNEVLTNAILHGNLKLDKNEFAAKIRSEMGNNYDLAEYHKRVNDEFDKLIQETAAKPEILEKGVAKVNIVAQKKSGEVVIEIQDNGTDSVIFWTEEARAHRESKIKNGTQEEFSGIGIFALMDDCKEKGWALNFVKNDQGIRATLKLTKE